MPTRLLRCPQKLLLFALLALHCAPSESALILQVQGLPDGAARLRLLPKFGSQAKPAFFVDAPVSEFAVAVPSDQAGRLIVEAMVEDGEGCYIAGQIVRAEFSEQRALQRVPLSLQLYDTRQCPVASFPSLRQVWMDRPDNAWTVGDKGSVLRWNGKSWVSTLAGRSEFVWGLWQNPSGEVWVVGDAGLILRWDGSRWNQHPGGTSVILTAIHGSSDEDVWAVGQQGTVLRWRGTSWESLPIPTLPNPSFTVLYGVWAESPSNVWVVGTLGAIVHWDGGSWSAPQVPSSPPPGTQTWATRYFNAVYGTSSDRVFISDAGIMGNILRRQGSGWVLDFSGGPNLYGMWPASPDTMWVVGDNYLYRRSGSTWLSDLGFRGTGVGWRSVWGSDPFHAIAVGYVSTPSVAGVLRYWNGVNWSDSPNF